MEGTKGGTKRGACVVSQNSFNVVEVQFTAVASACFHQLRRTLVSLTRRIARTDLALIRRHSCVQGVIGVCEQPILRLHLGNRIWANFQRC